jgi:hypothetical protein
MMTTTSDPQQYERELLARYARGEVSLEDVLQQLDERVHHVLYRSQATPLFHEDHLRSMVQQAQAYNAQHGITGILCYSEGQFIQVIEGEPAAVQALYARIARDPRHHQLEKLSEQAGARRLFGNWSMALVVPDLEEFYWLTAYITAHTDSLKAQLPVKESLVITLIQAFSKL